jgi:hypothetical protein
MKKIPDDIDNPIDNVLISIADKLCPYFHTLGHTPNMITTYSLITGIISCYFLYFKRITGFVIFYTLSYFFDCMDGHYARKYDMITKFGDMYDHMKDILVISAVLWITYIRNRKKIGRYTILFAIVLILLFVSHMSCQEINCEPEFKDRHNDYIIKSELLCPDKDYIKWTRFVGCGTVNLIMILFIIYSFRYQQEK